MAERRMFTKKITESDAFLDLPLSSQALYFHLNMAADDDGFVNNPKKIQRMIGASEDDYKLLIAKSFVLMFESGVIVVKHWKMHNYIQNDRYHPTVYEEEKGMLEVKQNGAYTLSQNAVDTKCIQDVYKMDTEVRLGKDRLDKDSLGEDRGGKKPRTPKSTYGEYKHVRLSDDEFKRLCDEFGLMETEKAIKKVDEYCQETGKTYKDYNLTIRRWGFDNKKSDAPKGGIDWSKV